MPIVVINYLAVLVAAVVSMALGAFWYSPAGFGKQWATLMGWNEATLRSKMKGKPTKEYAIAFVGSLVMAYVLAHFVGYAQATTLAEGLQAGFWTWLGFVATVTLSSVLWEGRPWKLYLLNNGYQLVNLLFMGAILAVWA